MERLLATGKAKAIGVANYSVDYLKDLLAHVSVVPAVNQVELHPRLPQAALLDFCRAHGIHSTAYSPLGSSGAPLLSLPAVQKIAERKGVSPGTVLLNYHGQSSLKIDVFSVVSNASTQTSPTRMLSTGKISHAAADTGEPKGGELGRHGHGGIESSHEARNDEVSLSGFWTSIWVV